jgi:hypothetical protein
LTNRSVVCYFKQMETSPAKYTLSVRCLRQMSGIEMQEFLGKNIDLEFRQALNLEANRRLKRREKYGRRTIA